MVLMRLQVFWGVFVSALFVLFCGDLACRAEGDIILKLANIGDDTSLGCSRPDGVVDNNKCWYRNGTKLANRDGFVISDPRYSQGKHDDGYADSNNIYISNITFSDSATFQCTDYCNDTLRSYDLRVIRCSNCITANHSNPDKMKVICTLDNYWTRQTLFRSIILNRNIYRKAKIKVNTFSFSIYLNELHKLHSEFYLRFEIDSRITCMLSTQSTPSYFYTTTLPTTSFKQTTQNRPSTSYAASKNVPVGRLTTVSQTKHHTPTYNHAKSDKRTTMLPRTSLKQTAQNTPPTLSYTAFKTLPVSRPTSISTTIHHTPTNKTANSDKRTTTLPTTSLKQTTQNRPSTLQYTASKRLPVRRPTSPNTNSDKNKRDGNITMIVVILGSAVILILIVIIIVLRRKQMSDRQENNHTSNASIKEEHQEVCYESVEDVSLKGPVYSSSIQKLRGTSLDPRRVDLTENGDMIDDISYDSTDNIVDSSISRVEGPLDNALYTLPDKRAAISREPKSTSKDRSSDSDHLYGNSVIITQHWQNRDILQQGDQYENFKTTGSGDDAEQIPLDDLPNKGLNMRNTVKATPEAGQTSTLSKDEAVSVDALYAQVDKTRKK